VSNMTDRDRKIMLSVIPLVLLLAYYFLLFSPRREEASKASKDLSAQQKRVTDAQAKVTEASASKTTFASDYTQMVRLGKAIPSKVDMPSLIVQLDQASNGTGIKFTKIATGARDAGATPPAATDSSPSTGGSSGNGTNGQPASAAGGAQAQTGVGKSAEKANNTAASENKSAASAGSTADAKAGGASTSGSSGSTSSSGAPATATTSAPPAGLETAPLDLEFEGNFFNLADFFHKLKRMVYVKGNNVAVSGRLVTIDSIKYSSDPDLFPKIKAELTATVFLSPQTEGTTAGATPSGPAAPSTTPAAAPSGTSSPPAATATPVGTR
jgi:hypothetical protein